MENPVVGFRFRPTDEELVVHYLQPKNLGGSSTSDVDQVINTVDICSVDPWDLPSLSKIKSRDLVWYFYGRKENKYNRGEKQSRKTISGFWSKTGKTMDIMRKRGNREKIGEKRVLVFKLLDKSKTKWVMHEYQALCVSPYQMMMTYTICKVKFNGEEREITSSSSGGEIENSRQFSGFLDVEQETQFEDAMRRAINNLSSEEWKSLIDDSDNDDDDQSKIVVMQEDCNNYKAQKPLTGVCIGYSSDDSDSDSISVTTVCAVLESSVEISSNCDSFGSSNYRIDQTKDLHESSNSSIELVPITQEVSHALGQGTEVGEHELGQEKIKKKKVGFFYRMIQRFVKKVHLCS